MRTTPLVFAIALVIALVAACTIYEEQAPSPSRSIEHEDGGTRPVGDAGSACDHGDTPDAGLVEGEDAGNGNNCGSNCWAPDAAITTDAAWLLIR